jgi:hypothetical protein
MKKIFILAGITMLSMAVLMMSGCARESSDNGKAGALLLGLNGSMTKEDAALSIISSVPNAQTTMRGSGGSSNMSSTQAILAEMHKNASKEFIKSQLSPGGARKSVVITTDPCEDGTCFTMSGTASCMNGGNLSFNNVKFIASMTMDSDYNMTMKGNMDGSISYAVCGMEMQNWSTYPDYINTVINGTIAEKDQFDYANSVIAGDLLSDSFTTASTEKGNKTVSSALLTVNGAAYLQVQLNCNSDLSRTTAVSNYSYSSVGNIFSTSGDYIETITGKVAVDGTLGSAGKVTFERNFNADTFRYHSECTMNMDENNISCKVTKM